MGRVGVEGEQEPEVGLGEVLRLVDDDGVVAGPVAGFDQLERAGAHVGPVRLADRFEPGAVLLVGAPDALAGAAAEAVAASVALNGEVRVAVEPAAEDDLVDFGLEGLCR